MVMSFYGTWSMVRAAHMHTCTACARVLACRWWIGVVLMDEWSGSGSRKVEVKIKTTKFLLDG